MGDRRRAEGRGPPRNPKPTQFWIVDDEAAERPIGPLASLGEAIDQSKAAGGGVSIYLGNSEGPSLDRYVMQLSRRRDQ